VSDGELPPHEPDRVVPEQVEALWAIKEAIGAELTPEDRQLLAALRVALGKTTQE
jgi:hypothetical protein